MTDGNSPSNTNIGQSAEGIIGQTVMGAAIGDHNQTIGQVLDGGMVVYGQVVIYNTSTVDSDSSTSKTRASEIGPNPYQGLLAFQETDGDHFFGRDQQIKDLWEKFRGVHEASIIRFLAIYGPSGSGKSSLARAGLIPELSRRPLPGRNRARVAVLIPGSHPLEALATVLAEIATGDRTPIIKAKEFSIVLQQPNSDGEYEGLRQIANALPEIAIKPLVVLVDQLEEVFTLCEDQRERDAFIGNLLCAASESSKRVSVIVTLRSDFLGLTQKNPHLNQLLASQGFFVAAMNVEGLREAITKPAELAGYPLDQSTVDLLIEQTEGREGALPLLQFALTQIWAGLAEGREPAETLRAIGGVGGALAKEAQRIFESLNSKEQKIAKRVFLGLVQLGEGTKDTRRRTELERIVSHGEQQEQVMKVIARFSDSGTRLITLADNAGTITAEVTHESLIDNWQQMRLWLNESRGDLRFQRRLDEAAIIWNENGRPDGNLWRSPDLDLLRQYHERADDDMTPLQIEFFNHSIHAFDEAEKKRKRQRVEQLVDKVEISLIRNQPINAIINAIAATGVSQSVLEQFPGHPKFSSVIGCLLDVVRVNSLEKNLLLHEDVVSSVAYSPDGKSIVSGCEDNTLQIWNARTGEPIGTRLGNPLKKEVGSGVTSVAFSPYGQRIASGHADNTVRLWNAITGVPIGNPLVHGDATSSQLIFDQTVTAYNSVNSVAFSPDGKYIISGSGDDTVRVWDANTGVPIGNPLKGHESSVYSVAYSPDGKYIVSGGPDNTILIWNAKRGAQMGRPLVHESATPHEDWTYSVMFSPDGQRIISGSGRTILIWDVNTRRLINTLQGHTDSVYSVAFSPNGQYIVSGGEDNTVRVWNATTGKQIGEPLRHEDDVKSVVFSPDGQHIVSGSKDNTVRIWSVSTNAPIGRILQVHSNRVTSVAFNPDGQYIASATRQPILMVRSADGRSLVSADSQSIASKAGGETVRISDVNTGQQMVQPLQVCAWSVAYSPNGQRIASGGTDKTVRIWDATTGMQIGKPLQGHEDDVKSVAYSPNGQRIASGGDKTVRIWDVTTGEQIGEPLCHEDDVKSVAYSPDGQRIASGGDKTVRIWDATTGMQIGKPLQGHREGISSVTFSPDGKHIISCSYDYTVRIWDAETGVPVGKPLQGHTDALDTAAYSPDGQFIVSGSRDCTVRIWDANTGVPIGKPLQGHTDTVSSVAFSPDGKRIVSGSWDNTVRVWDIAWESLLPIACNQLRYHPSLNQPTTDEACEAKQICERYVQEAQMVEQENSQIQFVNQTQTQFANQVILTPVQEQVALEETLTPFTSEEWQTLQYAPLWVFSAVAHADGKVDDQEFSVLAKNISKASLYKIPLTRDVFASILGDFNNIMGQYGADSRDVSEGLRDVVEILDSKVSLEESENFKQALIFLGVEIANASGGGFLGLGNKMSNEEASALSIIAALLEADLS
ncbi:NACHT and WD repeat domain-containing protein [Nostoc parmelioides]|uniref:Intraflagellar transport protein 122 homolog n=1 Tax=Nostoc parmelioides FACHB-3921 TaxID=2692909 RepID=A0ABR8BP41_9NOSO|nr:WD40 repeat domain-containing protein [Nostoc parmelioides]MBD2255300.1 WD40 repeat domain-containing protein [Nostoc parmelioides FACHB-3921]